MNMQKANDVFLKKNVQFFLQPVKVHSESVFVRIVPTYVSLCFNLIIIFFNLILMLTQKGFVFTLNLNYQRYVRVRHSN